jgi:hypothetical protein
MAEACKGGDVGEDISERLGHFEKLGPKAARDGPFLEKSNLGEGMDRAQRFSRKTANDPFGVVDVRERCNTAPA